MNDQIASRMAVTLPLTLAAFGISLIVAILIGALLFMVIFAGVDWLIRKASRH